MAGQVEFDGIDEYIQDLQVKAGASRAATKDYELQVEFLAQQRKLLEKYAQLPLAMQITQFLIEQIVPATTGTTEAVVTKEEPSPERVTRLRPRPRVITARAEAGGESRGKEYNIAPQVKPIMNALVGGGPDAVPETLDQLFDRMYSGQDWRARTVFAPMGIRRGHQRIPYGDDLASDDSVIRRLIRGADRIICEKMKGNSDPLFTHRARKAAPELIQIYRKVETVGWEVYDGFMVRNAIRETHAGS